MTKFKIGDKVVIKTREDEDMFPIGTEGVISSDEGDCYAVTANDDYWFYGEDELEPASD